MARSATSLFWEYVEHELDQILGGHRVDDARRAYGANDALPDVDTEGDAWFGDYPEERQ